MAISPKFPTSSVMEWIRGVCLPFEARRKARLVPPPADLRVNTVIDSFVDQNLPAQNKLVIIRE